MEEEFITANPLLGLPLIIIGIFLFYWIMKYLYCIPGDYSPIIIFFAIMFIPGSVIATGVCYTTGDCYTREYSNYLKECKNTTDTFNNQIMKIFNNIDEDYIYTYNYDKFSQLITECDISTKELVLKSFDQFKREHEREYNRFIVLTSVPIFESVDDMACNEILYNLNYQSNLGYKLATKEPKLKIFIDKYIIGIMIYICI